MSQICLDLFQEFDNNNQEWLLTSAFGVELKTVEPAYDFEMLCPQLDFLNLMMYDLHGSWDDMTGHHTSFVDHPNLGNIAFSLVRIIYSYTLINILIFFCPYYNVIDLYLPASIVPQHFFLNC